MKTKIVAIFVLSMLLLASCKDANTTSEEKVAIKAAVDENKPLSTYVDLEGNPIALSDYKGKRIFLNYWATWCGPCIQEMPAILRLQSILEKENYVFLLASDQAISKINAFKKAKKFDFNFIKFNGTFADVQISALPATFIYNEAGEEVKRIDGSVEWDAPEMIKNLKELH